MFKYLKNVLCLFLVIGSSLVVASSDDIKRNNEIALLNKENEAIFRSSNKIYAIKPSYPVCLSLSDDISFSATPVKSGYLANMISRSYIAPMKIYAQNSDFMVRAAEDLLEDDFIGMYAGNVVRNDINLPRPLHSRQSIMRQKSKPEEGFIIDASVYSNELSLAQKSPSKSVSNCQWVDVLGKDGRAHVVCIASRYIHRGERLIVHESDQEIARVKELKQQAQIVAQTANVTCGIAFAQAAQNIAYSYAKVSTDTPADKKK